jgi:hypothetical protein
MSTLTKLSIAFVLAGAFLHAAPAAADLPGRLQVRVPAHRAPQVAATAFDIDDNTLRLPTKIWIVNAASGRQRSVSTADWAIARAHFAPAPDGKTLVGSGRFTGYKVDLDAHKGAFREFYDHPGEGHVFADTVKSALARGGKSWQGPAWRSFVEAMSDPDTARRATFITARGHSPEGLREGFAELQARGFIKYLPPKENFFPVNRDNFQFAGKVVAGDNATRKTVVMRGVLDEVQANGFGRRAVPVVAPDGKGTRTMQTWSFSDDDYGNYQKAVTSLSTEVAQGRWPDVKITLEFTGRNDPAHRPESVVLRPDGTTRPQLAAERAELTRIAATH